MIVKELINKLKEFPQDMKVQTDGFIDIDDVKIHTWVHSNYPYNEPDENRVIIEWDMKNKLYILIDKNLDPIYGAVQGGHAVAEWLIEHG